MKANVKRIFALLLCLVLCLGLIPVTMPTEVDAAGNGADSHPTSKAAAIQLIKDIFANVNATFQKHGWKYYVKDSNGETVSYCGDYVGTTMYHMGITSTNSERKEGGSYFAYYKSKTQSSGGYSVTSYTPPNSITKANTPKNIKSVLNSITNNGTKNAYNILLDFKGSPGHVLFIYAIIGGEVYWTEVAPINKDYTLDKPSGGTDTGTPLRNTIAKFAEYYGYWRYPFQGAIHFGGSSSNPPPTPTPTPPSFGAPSKTNGQNSSVNFGVKVQSTLSYSSSAKPSRWGVDIATSEALLKSSPTHVGLNSKYSRWLYDSISYKPGNSGETVSIDFSVEAANTSLLVAGTTYYYRFWTQYTANGDSSLKAYSASKSFTTPGTAPQFTVTYNGNGGTPGKSSDKVNQGSSVTLPSATRTNSSAGSYTVTLNANGGSVSPGSLSAARTTSYSFKNWNTAQGGTGSAYNSGAGYKPSGNVTLYAQWNSSTGTAPVTLPTPARSGYSFKGWATSSTASSGTTGSYTPSGNVTLYATWQRTTYTITYNGNGGTPSRYSDTVTAGASVTFPTATRPGYCFLGWSPSAGEKGVYLGSSGGGSFTPSGDTTLYAVWQKDTPPRRPGDVNQDSVVDGKDVTRLCRYLAGFDVSISRQNADVNGDGQVDGKDVTRLRRYLAGFSIELL